MILNGIFNPVASAGLGVMFIIGRVVYASGYSEKGPEGRKFGAIVSGVAQIVLILGTIYRGFSLILGW